MFFLSGVIDDAPLRFRGEVYHGYHFNCTACGAELDSSAREVKNRTGYAANDMNELYCLRCHDRMGIPICGACRRPIEERVVTALGKHWHVEVSFLYNFVCNSLFNTCFHQQHFVCAKCEKPFLGHRHYEKRGLAYCETHYHQLFGNLCFVCNQVIGGDGKYQTLRISKLPYVYALYSSTSIHRAEQGMVCAPLLVLDLRYQNGSKVEILRIRRKARLQEMLRAFP